MYKISFVSKFVLLLVHIVDSRRCVIEINNLHILNNQCRRIFKNKLFFLLMCIFT